MSGFNLGSAVNGFADWVCSAPIIRGVVNNPVFTSLLITALAAVVVMALYGKPVRHGGSKRGCRALIYVFLIVTAVIFVHHYAVLRMARDTDHTAGVRAVYAGIEASRAVSGGGTAPVVHPPAAGHDTFRADNIAAEHTAATDPLEGIADVVLPLGVRSG